MKSILLLALFACVISAADPTFKYAGTTVGSATFNYPVVSSSSCDPSSGAAPYVNFTVTFSNDGVREIAAMAERNFKSNLAIFVYSSFNPTTPCNGLLYVLDKKFGFSGGPVIDDFPFFAAGSYAIVVTGDGGGLFAVNVNPSVAVGTISATNGNWSVPTIYNDECSDSGNTALYNTYTFTQTDATGYYDLYALLHNTSYDYIYANIILYQGIPLASGLYENPCNNTLTNATIEDLNSAQSGGVYIPYAYLTQGRVYTLVFSSSNIGQTLYYGLQVIPTRIRFQQPSAWVQPSRDLTSACDDSSYDEASWDSVQFLTEERAYLIDTADPPYPFSYFDTYSFLYQGYNLGVAPYISPATCPFYAPLVNAGDTGDITPVFALVNPGVNYTVVVSTYSGGNRTFTSDYPYAYVLYLFTGVPIGNLPPPTVASTTTTTTGAAATTSTTAAAATTSTTGAAATTSTTGAAATTATTAAAASTSTTKAATTSTTAAAASTSTTKAAATTSTTAAAATTNAATSSKTSTTTATAGQVTTSTSGAPQTVVTPVALVCLVIAAMFMF